MFDALLKLLVGDIDDKRAYYHMMKRVNALPKDYRYAYRKIQHYMNTVGLPNGDMTIFEDLTMFLDLLVLFETSAAEGKKILDVIGNDFGHFSDEFMRASSTKPASQQKNLNKEILDKMKKGANHHD